jgi:high-affinity iron transporter
MGFIDDYFSIYALFVLFRESIEASIIVSVLLQFLARSFPQLKKQGKS